MGSVGLTALRMKHDAAHDAMHDSSGMVAIGKASCCLNISAAEKDQDNILLFSPALSQ